MFLLDLFINRLSCPDLNFICSHYYMHVGKCNQACDLFNIILYELLSLSCREIFLSLGFLLRLFGPFL